MSESATEQYLAELEAAEAQATGVLDDAEAQGGEGLNGRAGAALRRTRKILNQHKAAIERVRSEVAAEVREQMIAERKAEAGYRRLGVPEGPARALFTGIDSTDEQAMQARAAELRSLGISWDGQPQASAPPAPDPNLAAQVAMMAAAAGGATVGSAGDLKRRMLDMEANPGNYSQEAIDAVVWEFNRAVDSAARTGTSGALG